MIKVIIFDADGVLIYTERRFSILLAEKYEISLEKTLPFFNGPFQDCVVGKADLKETVQPYLSIWGWANGLDNFLDIWFQEGHKTNKELVEYIQELRQKGMLCFLATDNEKHRFAHMLKKMGFSKSFDKTYASAHLGHRKTSQEFFSKIFKELKNIQKDEVLFVDDDIENIQVAKEFGIHAHLYASVEDLKKKLSILNKK